MGEWENTKLGAFVESVSETYKFAPDEKVIFLNTSDIYLGRVLNHTPEDASKFPGQAKKMIRKDDFLFSEIRPANGRYALVDFDAEKYVVSTKLMVLRCNENIDVNFFRLFLTAKDTLDHLQMIAEDRSGTFPQITFDHIRTLDISLPKLLSEQKAIASVLSSLDDKIDLLHRQNKTLEAMAETLFRQWFVEEAREDWEEKSLLDVIQLIGGGTPKTSIPEYWDGDIPWLTGGDIASNHKSFVNHSAKSITELGLNKSSAKLFPQYATVISARGTVGKYCMLAKPMAFSQSNYGILPNIPGCFLFTYLIVSHLVDELQSSAYGSVFDTITTNTFKEINFSLPGENDIQQFEQNISPYFDKILLNTNQIHTLEKLRDTLLPKLMSGEVRVAV